MADSFVIFDSEWTAWEGAKARCWNGPGEEMELVQIGMAKLIDTRELEEIEHLEVLIQPVINPLLSDYFVNLTGITQEMVENDGLLFPKAIPAVEAFLRDDVNVVYSFGIDGSILKHNYHLNDLIMPFSPDMFVSIMPRVAEFFDKPTKDMLSSRLPQDLGFKPPGNAHNALADARCIAETLRIMRRGGAF